MTTSKSPMRELVEAGGNPFIKLVFPDTNEVTVTAQGVEAQNILPILAAVVKGMAIADTEDTTE